MSANLLARGAVAAIGAVVLVFGAVGATSAFRTAVTSESTDPARPTAPELIYHAQFECIRAEIAEQIVPGSLVHVPLDPAAPDPDLWKQRLIEMAFPVATIVAEPVPGSTTLTVAVDATPEGCSGVRLVVLPEPAAP